MPVLRAVTPEPNQAAHSIPSSSPSPEPDLSPELEWVSSEPNEFGIFRSYQHLPGRDHAIQNPDNNLGLEDLCNAPGLSVSPDTAGTGRWWSVWGSKASVLSPKSFFAPFLNATVFRLMSWFYGGSNMKTLAELDALVNDVLLADDFKVSDLKGFSAAREAKRMDAGSTTNSSSCDHPQVFTTDNGWKESSVKLPLNAEHVKHSSENTAPVLEVGGVHHRSLVEVIKTAFSEESAKGFHYTPFREFWQPSPDKPPERIYSELYNSDAFIQEHANIMQQPPEPGPTLETAIAGIMLWSDSTHLANFGTASLWPIYAFFGNQSKYARAKPSSFAAHHVAYIPSV